MEQKPKADNLGFTVVTNPVFKLCCKVQLTTQVYFNTVWYNLNYAHIPGKVCLSSWISTTPEQILCSIDSIQ